MRVRFEYSTDRDVWCLLNKGKSSHNSSGPTQIYQELVAQAGENPNPGDAQLFVENYIKEHRLNPEALRKDWESDFILIAEKFQTAAEIFFGVSLKKELTAYLTVNTRCPYNIEEEFFFVSMTKPNPLLTVMHELWHFYTWERFGEYEQTRLGKEVYNNLKEALTVLINIECAELLPKNVQDAGYGQHQELRSKILEWRSKSYDIEQVWEQAAQFSGA